MKNRHKEVMIGVDEAGRGCVFGPVFVAATVKKANWHSDRVTDSKKITPKCRTELCGEIRENMIWSCANVPVETIDRVGINKSVVIAGQMVVEDIVSQLKTRKFPSPYFVTFDGDDWEDGSKLIASGEYVSVISEPRADMNVYECSAASIVAKVLHDQWIDKTLSDNREKLKHYRLSNNRGYGTAYMQVAIQDHGLTEWHRKKFCNTLTQTYLAKHERETPTTTT